jgi:hypothetical protein
MKEKSLREDNSLELRATRARAGRASSRDDDDALDAKPASLWLGPVQGAAGETETALAGTRGTASALPYRAELEAALGADLAGVRAYADAHAARASDQLGADAYALRDQQAIVFGHASPSKALVAHEVVHMLQRGGGAEVEDEAEADAIGDRLAAGEHVDARTIRSGGGALRKKQKSDLSGVFDDFLRGRDVRREGALLTETSADRTSELDEEGTSLSETSTYGAKQLHADGRFASEETRSVNTLGFGKLSSSDEHTTRTGRVEDPEVVVRTAIQKARNEVFLQRLATDVKKFKARAERSVLQRELGELESGQLDPSLVAAKRALLGDQIAKVDERIREHEGMTAALQRLAVDLEHNEKLLASTDPAQVALRLADAEAMFVGTETKTRPTFEFDAMAGTLTRGRVTSTEEVGGEGTSKRTTSTSTKTKLGGGLARENTTAHASSWTDAAGNTETRESSVTSSRRLIADDKGAVGAGAGKNLSGALENSYGKVTGGVGLDGAVTANIIEIPQPDGEKPLYAVVVTIQVGAAIEAGLERSKAALSANAGASAVLTQTRVLDAAATKDYLERLDATANGGKASGSEPELAILSKAVQTLQSADDVAGGLGAALTSSDCAKQMATDESVEVTTQVSGGVDASLGGKTLGVSAGAARDQYRTLKIGRVAGKAGQTLVEIVVSFGDSSDRHGALTGAALGVSASYGQKAWGSTSEAVTFRLDDQAPGFDALYDEIVGTLSRAELIELRKSRRFANHVRDYTSTIARGGEATVALEGMIGLHDKSSHARTSERGMVDGELSISETGSQTRSTGFSIGPLELLRNTRTDSATFEIEDGITTLDVSERVGTSKVGKFDPSAQALLTEESPAKAAEKALLVTEETLAGFFLSRAEIHVLADKAKNEPEAWGKVQGIVFEPFTSATPAAWERLRRQLARPRLEAGVPIEIARDLALGSAVADFMTEGENAKAADYVRIALRDWSRLGGLDGTPGGVQYEFSQDVSKATYADLRHKCMALPTTLATFAADQERGLAPGLEYIAELQVGLAKLIHAIEESYEFSAERSRIEMITELRTLAATIPAAQRDFERRCTGVEITVEQGQLDARADQRAQIEAVEKALATSKRSEVWMLDRLEQRTRDYKGQVRANEMKPLLDNLDGMYEVHVILVKQLRAAYTAACVADSAWKCSHHARERKELDIDYPRYADLYETYRRSTLSEVIGQTLEKSLEERERKYGMY